MNGAQINTLLVLTALAIIGFGPVSITCLIGMHVVISRPRWFYRLTRSIYRDASPGRPMRSAKPRSLALGVRFMTFLSLLFLLILDIAPVPVTGAIAIYVVLTRPAWFQSLVFKVYGEATP